MTDSRIVPLLSCFLYNSLAAEDNGRVSLYNYWHAAMPDNYPSAPGTGSPATSSDATLHPLARLPEVPLWLNRMCDDFCSFCCPATVACQDFLRGQYNISSSVFAASQMGFAMLPCPSEWTFELYVAWTLTPVSGRDHILFICVVLWGGNVSVLPLGK